MAVVTRVCLLVQGVVEPTVLYDKGVDVNQQNYAEGRPIKYRSCKQRQFYVNVA